LASPAAGAPSWALPQLNDKAAVDARAAMASRRLIDDPQLIGFNIEGFIPVQRDLFGTKKKDPAADEIGPRDRST
jgi:hypothetical protein